MQRLHKQRPDRPAGPVHTGHQNQAKAAANAVRPKQAGQAQGATVLELLVDNHAGTMSHICGLFSRRAFSLEGILCLPVGDGGNSRMWLRVLEQERLDQVVAQLAKLEEVISIRRAKEGDTTFGDLAERYLPPEERLAEDGPGD